MKRNKQKKATVTVDEYNDIVKAEQALQLNGADFIVTMAGIVNDGDSYRDIKPHVERIKCKGMK